MIGFDDVDLAEIVGLTTIRQPLREGGALAADLLLRGDRARRRPSPSRSCRTLTRRRAAHDVIEPVLSADGLAVRVGAAGRAGRSGALPRAVRPRRADHLAAAAAASGRRSPARRCTRWRRGRACATTRGTLEAAGQDRARVPRRAAGVVRAAGWPDGGEFRYYGTADATAWFLVVLAASGERGLRGGGRARPRAGSRARSTPAAGCCATRRARSPAGSPSRAGATRSTPPPTPDGGGYVRADGTNPAPPLADADTQAVAVRRAAGASGG